MSLSERRLTVFATSTSERHIGTEVTSRLSIGDRNKQKVNVRGGRGLAVAQRVAKKRRVVPWLHPTNGSDLAIWESLYHLDHKVYLCRATPMDMTMEKARNLKDKVAFCPS